MSNVVKKVVDGLKESTKAAHEITKESFNAQKQQTRKLHQKAVTPDPNMAEFKEAKGLKAKTKVAIKGLKENTAKVKEQQTKAHYDATHLVNTKETLSKKYSK